MGENKREFILRHLMQPGFMTHESQTMILEEKKDSGKSRLVVQLLSEENLCIANVDDKHTLFQFFRGDEALSMMKRVDHMIFEHQQDKQWKLHLIEMKSSVGEKKWKDIKGKFRASYLLGQAIAGMLEIEIAETMMYTTFEKVQFTPSDTMPSGRRSRSGRVLVRMEEEWSGKQLGLNFGERYSFVHIPVPMSRNEEGILTGKFVEKNEGC